MQHAAVATSCQGTACNALVAESLTVVRLLSPCCCRQQPGFFTLLQVRRGQWGDMSAVYKLWDLTRDANGIQELFHKVSMLRQLQALQVVAILFCLAGLRCAV